jgi:tellurite resistance protein TerC
MGDTTAAAEHFPLDTIAIFVGAFLFSIVVDLIQHRGRREVSVRDATIWSIFWLVLALSFAGWLNYRHGGAWANMFVTGYVLEMTLSIDNLMVFIAVFKFFRIDGGLQHRILYFGILGAIIFRLLFVVVGTGFLELAGPWALLIFGFFVGWAGWQMLRGGDDDEDAEPNYTEMGLVRFFERVYPVFPHLFGDRFFITRAEAEAEAKRVGASITRVAERYMTPAFVCLLVIEGSDVLFAFDSVPAVIAVTKEPLLVYAAMIFAILGLRSLYFILLVLTKFLVHLEKAVTYVLFFIAAKMFLEAAQHFHDLGWLSWAPPHVSANASMMIVLGILAIGVVASLIWPAKEEAAGA